MAGGLELRVELGYGLLLDFVGVLGALQLVKNLPGKSNQYSQNFITAKAFSLESVGNSVFLKFLVTLLTL